MCFAFQVELNCFQIQVIVYCRNCNQAERNLTWVGKNKMGLGVAQGVPVTTRDGTVERLNFSVERLNFGVERPWFATP